VEKPMVNKRNLLDLLRSTYVAFHREGWEEGQTVGEVMDDIRELLAEHDMLPVFEVIEEVP
jgi:urease gamma subunit